LHILLTCIGQQVGRMLAGADQTDRHSIRSDGSSNSAQIERTREWFAESRGINHRKKGSIYRDCSDVSSLESAFPDFGVFMKKPAQSNVTSVSKRETLLCFGGSATLAVVTSLGTWTIAHARVAKPAPLLEVWKDPDCGCCKDWVALMTQAGFQVKTHDSGNRAKRKQLGLSEKLGSCHTATVAGYVVEGHVPADAIKRLLAERPNALGLAVPGMPVGSPGMDGPAYGGRKDAFNVLLVQTDGRTSVWQAG
jgi:hypothetical protein